MSIESATSREFFLYWVGVVVIAFSIVSVLLTISGLVTDVLSTQCYFPYVSSMLGVKEPPQPANVTMFANPQPPPNRTMSPEQNVTRTISYELYPYPYPYYCGGNPIVAVIGFIFKLLSSLIFIGVGGYMVMNGKKR